MAGSSLRCRNDGIMAPLASVLNLKMMESAEVGSEQAVFEMYGLLYADFHVHCRKFKGQFGGPSLL